MRRVSSLLVSLVAGVGGFALLFWASGTYQRMWGEYTGDFDQLIVPALLVVVASILIGVAAYALRWSALGPIVLGGLVLVFSAVNGLAIATAHGAGGPGPLAWVMRLSVDAGPIGWGAFFYLTNGFGAVAGLLLVVTALVGRSARVPSAGARVLSAVAGLFVTAALIAAARAGNELTLAANLGRVVMNHLMPLLVFFVFALAAVVLTVVVRWSTLVLWVPGVLLGLLGVFTLFVPSANSMLASLGARPNGTELYHLVTGLVLLGLALGIRSHRKRRAAVYAGGGMNGAQRVPMGASGVPYPPYGGYPPAGPTAPQGYGYPPSPASVPMPHGSGYPSVPPQH